MSACADGCAPPYIRRPDPDAPVFLDICPKCGTVVDALPGYPDTKERS